MLREQLSKFDQVILDEVPIEDIEKRTKKQCVICGKDIHKNPYIIPINRLMYKIRYGNWCQKCLSELSTEKRKSRDRNKK